MTVIDRTSVVEDTFVIHGLRVCRRVISGGDGQPTELVWLRSLDGRRVVGFLLRTRDALTGSIAHFRDRGDDVLGQVELDELIAAAHERWPAHGLQGR